MTAKFAIVTDSTSDLPSQIVSDRQIYITPLHILWGQDHYVDGVDMSPEAFHERLASDSKLPTSSQPTPNEFVAMYKRAIEETGAEGILALTLSADLSGTYASAVSAASDVDFPVRVVDTRTASVATGLIVMRTADARDKGMSLDDAAELAQSYAASSELFFMVDTLEYLHRGGRIGGARRLLGTALNIKPILYVNDGRVEPSESIRTRKRAVNRLVEMVEEKVDPSRPLYIAVLHSNAEADAEALEATIRQRWQPKQIIKNTVSAVISVHTGPGALGCAILQ